MLSEQSTGGTQVLCMRMPPRQQRSASKGAHDVATVLPCSYCGISCNPPIKQCLFVHASHKPLNTSTARGTVQYAVIAPCTYPNRSRSAPKLHLRPLEDTAAMDRDVFLKILCIYIYIYIYHTELCKSVRHSIYLSPLNLLRIISPFHADALASVAKTWRVCIGG
eukprot:IDg20231t1